MLNKKLFFSIMLISFAYADDYISNNNYIQNPFNGQPSGGGTQFVTESHTLDQNVWQKWFTDGTYNVQAASTLASVSNNNYFAYGANVFGQTGSVAGFFFGGNMAIINPVYSNEINNNNGTNLMQFLPSNQVIFPNQLFVEYKVEKYVQADVGWLYITTPWLSSSDSLALQQPTYQGGLVNLELGSNVLLTGLALNGYMPLSSTGFSGSTLYNDNYDFGSAYPNIHDAPSSGTLALGVQYGLTGSWHAQLWGYQFQDYANLAYADTKYTLTINPDTNITFAGQAAIEGSQGNNVMAQNGYGAPQSNMLGAQVGVNYAWLGFLASFNQVWGNGTGYQGGGLVSPYTYQLATDPLYTTAVIAGLVEKSAGNAYKLAPTFTFFNNSFVISPAYSNYATAQYPASTEWDLNLTYSLPQARGLTFSGIMGYLVQPTVEDVSSGNTLLTQFMVSYVY